ncbi:MAG: 50S ribosomal protein L20 [Nitrospinae bacterium]|nr:50S ribosomal protein L20 [Nitrospinota bacterium]
MPRAIDGSSRRKRRKKILKLAKGFQGTKKNLFRDAREAVDRSLKYAYRDRRRRKRDFRRLWIIRINIAARQEGITYNRFITGLKSAQIDLNRKILADMAVNDPASFKKLVGVAKDKVA